MMSRSKRSRRDAAGPTVGVYEAHTAIPHCKNLSSISLTAYALVSFAVETSTQSTRARWEVVPDKNTILGGTKVGNGAWGLAWVDTVMEPSRDHDAESERARQVLWQSVSS